MEVVDIWPKGVTPQGHTPGAWDCPCGPWILTMDGRRTIRHTPDLAPPNGERNPARPGDCARLCGAPGCASWGCLR